MRKGFLLLVVFCVCFFSVETFAQTVLLNGCRGGNCGIQRSRTVTRSRTIAPVTNSVVVGEVVAAAPVEEIQPTYYYSQPVYARPVYVQPVYSWPTYSQSVYSGRYRQRSRGRLCVGGSCR